METVLVCEMIVVTSPSAARIEVEVNAHTQNVISVSDAVGMDIVSTMGLSCSGVQALLATEP